MFHLVDNLGLKLVESEFFHLLQDGIPGQTWYALIMCIYDRLLFLRRDSIGFVGSDEDPASSSPISILSSATGSIFPDEAVWNKPFPADRECQLLIVLIANPSLVKKENLDKLHYIDGGPMRRGLIATEKGMLVLNEPIAGKGTYRILRTVPRDL